MKRSIYKSLNGADFLKGLLIAFLTALFTGLLLIVTHKLIISHLIGFLVVENAVFLFSLAIGKRI